MMKVGVQKQMRNLILAGCIFSIISCQKNSETTNVTFAKLSQVKNDVFEKRANDLTFIPASEGDPLERGDYIETKEASKAEVLYRANGNLVSIDEHTLIKIDEGQTSGKKSEKRTFDLASLKHGDIEAKTKDRELWVAVSSGVVQLSQKSKASAKISVSGNQGLKEEKIKIEVTSGEAVVHSKNAEGKVVSDKVHAGSPVELTGIPSTGDANQAIDPSSVNWVKELSESDVPEVELKSMSIESLPSVGPSGIPSIVQSIAPTPSPSPSALPSRSPLIKAPKSVTPKPKPEVNTKPTVEPALSPKMETAETKFIVLEPKEAFFETNQETFNVSGTKSGSIESVYLNNEKVDFASDGRFSKAVSLKMGTNVLLFRVEFTDKSKDPLFVKKTVFRKGG